jgi:hypothetical protein
MFLSLLLLLFFLFLLILILSFNKTNDSYDIIKPTTIKKKFIGTCLVNDAPINAPIAPVIAIIIKIVNDMFLFLRCCIAAVIAPRVLTPILVPTDSVTLRPVDKIKGNLITPRTKPTIPPIKLMIKPIKDKNKI